MSGREDFIPEVGKIYENQGGGKYLCVGFAVGSRHPSWCPKLRNVASGWTLLAHHVGIYPNGKIDWAYSTDGYFERSS